MSIISDIDCGLTDFPAAKMLLPLPLLTSMAVTGPGRSLEPPTLVQVLLAIANCATFATVPSASAREPATTTVSLLSYDTQHHQQRQQRV